MADTLPIPEKPLLALHAAIDGKSLWDACQKLLGKCFTHQFLVGGFSFRGDMPMIIKRTKPAPERDAAWWARNAEIHPLMHLMMDPKIKVHRVTDSIAVEEIKIHPYYHEFMEPEDWLYSVGLFFRQDSHMTGMLAVNRREDQGEFGAQEMDLFHRLHPHFATAIQRVAQIQADRSSTASMASMLSRLPLPVAIVSWTGELNYINDTARQACLTWANPNGSFQGAETLSSATLPPEILTACLDYAQHHQSEQTINHPPLPKTVTIRHPDDPTRRVVIEPLGAPTDPLSQPVFLLRFDLPQSRHHTATLLQKLSELSTAEKAVTEQLMAGESNRQIAHNLGKSEGTVKKQLESIYRKLGVHDRLRLVALLQGSSRLD